MLPGIRTRTSGLRPKGLNARLRTTLRLALGVTTIIGVVSSGIARTGHVQIQIRILR